jgi:DnaK suppressor protein
MKNCAVVRVFEPMADVLELEGDHPSGQDLAGKITEYLESTSYLVAGGRTRRQAGRRPAAGRACPRRGEISIPGGGDPMSPMVEEFRIRLQQARQELLRRVATTGTELATLEAHPAGNLDADATTEIASTVLARLEGREKHELDEIDAAMTRLEAGSFGACEDCGTSIPLGRLRAVPWARYCLNCQLRRPA